MGTIEKFNEMIATAKKMQTASSAERLSIFANVNTLATGFEYKTAEGWQPLGRIILASDSFRNTAGNRVKVEELTLSTVRAKDTLTPLSETAVKPKATAASKPKPPEDPALAKSVVEFKSLMQSYPDRKAEIMRMTLKQQMDPEDIAAMFRMEKAGQIVRDAAAGQ